MNSRYSWENQLAGGAAGMAMLLAIVALLVILWLAVKAAELVVRVLAAHPRSRPLWVAIGLLFAAGLGVAATGGEYALVNALAAVSLPVLVAVARTVELYHDRLLQPEWTRDAVVHRVLHEPWWRV